MLLFPNDYYNDNNTKSANDIVCFTLKAKGIPQLPPFAFRKLLLKHYVFTKFGNFTPTPLKTTTLDSPQICSIRFSFTSDVDNIGTLYSKCLNVWAGFDKIN